MGILMVQEDFGTKNILNNFDNSLKTPICLYPKNQFTCLLERNGIFLNLFYDNKNSYTFFYNRN